MIYQITCNGITNFRSSLKKLFSLNYLFSDDRCKNFKEMKSYWGESFHSSFLIINFHRTCNRIIVPSNYNYGDGIDGEGRLWLTITIEDFLKLTPEQRENDKGICY